MLPQEEGHQIQIHLHFSVHWSKIHSRLEEGEFLTLVVRDRKEKAEMEKEEMIL